MKKAKPKQTTLSIPVHPEIKQQLRLVADAIGLSVSDIVRDLIRKKINATPKGK